MLIKVRYIIFLFGLLIFFSCEDEVSSSSRNYVPIEAQLWGLEFQGYDGYIVADWEITNTSDLNISGWEVHTVITMINDQIETGLFFRHDIDISPGDSVRDVRERYNPSSARNADVHAPSPGHTFN